MAKTRNDNSTSVEDTLRQALQQSNAQISQLNQKIATQNNALQILEAQRVQLEGTIEAAQTQRDRLLDTEADAIANKYILEKAKDHEIVNLKAQIDRMAKEAKPDEKKLISMERDLNEVREKFGRVQHEKMQAISMFHKFERKVEESNSAMMWAIDYMSTSRVNVVKRFAEATGYELTPELLLKAYQDSGFFRPEEMSFIDFLVETNNKYEAELYDESEDLNDISDADLVREVDSVTSSH